MYPMMREVMRIRPKKWMFSVNELIFFCVAGTFAGFVAGIFIAIAMIQKMWGA